MSLEELRNNTIVFAVALLVVTLVASAHCR